MSEDRLTGLLGSLRHERMDRVADDRTRARLENVWSARRRRASEHRVRRLAPLLATFVLLAGLGTATLNASGDSLLYGVRVAIEDAAVLLRAEPGDRNEYLLALLDQRQAEAARLESMGNTLAASRVREIELETLRRLEAALPKLPDEATVTKAVPTETPAPSPSASPSPLQTANLALRTASPTPRPTPTPTPRAPTPTLAPDGTPFPVTLTGNVKNADLTLADGACVGFAPPADPAAACTAKTVQGTYRLTVSGRLYQNLTVYAWRVDPVTRAVYKGSATATVKGGTVQMPDIKLVKQI